MSLEEIESRLGSILQADTVSQLKSTVWKERLEGWLSSLSTLFIVLLFGRSFVDVSCMDVPCDVSFWASHILIFPGCIA